MQAIGFYFALPFLYFIAYLPFRFIYLISNVLYFFIITIGYRKKVVKTNLTNSFPHKSEQEIDKLCKQYYSYLCDLILETIKTLGMTAEEAKKHCIFHHQEWLDKLHDEGKSILIVMGHYGNWEMAGPSFTLNNKYQLVVIYKPLSNPYFEKFFVKMRTKFGTQITPVNNTLREMVARKNTVTATAFIADQTARPEDAYWTNFLNQDTAVFLGPEKLAKKFGYPVVYMSVNRTKRGYYEITPELMFEDPKSTAENEISAAFTKRLEKEILKEPSTWLWSHKRWKPKRPANRN